MRKFLTMVWEPTKPNIVPILIGAVIGWGILTVGMNRGYRNGYKRGLDDGIDATLDTVNKIVQKQIHSDTTATKITFDYTGHIHTYILSKKTIVKK